MNDFWYKATIFGLLLMFVCAPFAGFAPLLLIILFGGAYWFFAPIFRAFFNKPEVAGRAIDLEDSDPKANKK